VATAANAQTAASGDVALTYHWVRTNTTPGECGCFGLNGGGVSGSWEMQRRFAGVVGFSSEHAGNVLGTGMSLTLTSYMAGARYRLPKLWSHKAHGLEPFAQVLLGATHSGGSVAGSADGQYAFATRMGGGVDVPVSAHIAIRIVQVDYNLTLGKNFSNDRQNNLLVGGGIVC